EAEALFERFHRLVTGRLEAGEAETLGKLAVFSGVSEFPIRVKCASLAWHAMREAVASGSAWRGRRRRNPFPLLCSPFSFLHSPSVRGAHCTCLTIPPLSPRCARR